MILVGIGANLSSAYGPPQATIQAALRALDTENTHVAAVSSFYRTAAWPDPTDPEFVNAAARLDTRLSARNLLDFLHAVETAFGRDRSRKNAPRTLDLDLLDYEGRVEAGPPLLPHPGIATRAFVLVPLRDIAPEWRHPVTGTGIDEMLHALPTGTAPPIRIAENGG